MTTILRVNLVLNIHDGQVEADRAGALLCSDPAMLRDLAFYQSRHLPASLEYDEATRRISAVGSAPVDLVLAVSMVRDEAPRLTVQLMRRPTLLYLSKTNNRFAELYSLLETAVSRKKPVAIGVLPAGSAIEDVRVDDWQR